MATLAAERTENVKRSLFNYIEVNWTDTTKEFQGSGVLDTTAVDEWVWFGMTGEAQPYFLRHTDGTNLGELYHPLLHCVINVKPTQTVTRIDAIRDGLENLLRRVSIAVLDYVGGTNAQVGKLLGQGVLTAQPLGFQNDVNQFSLMFRMQYLRQFTA